MQVINGVKSIYEPQPIEITSHKVFLAKNVQECVDTLDDCEIHGYIYDYIIYDKDEYIKEVFATNTQAISDLQEELKATKILLGVE